jgi:hypothetical protein
VLLVLTDDGLHRVKAREFGHGYAIEKTPLDVVKALLATHDLHIVTAAEKAVLDAMAQLPEELLRSWVDASQVTRGLPQLAVAELARREAKP